MKELREIVSAYPGINGGAIVRAINAKRVFQKHRNVFGVAPDEISKVNIQRLQERLGEISSRELELFNAVCELLARGECRHRSRYGDKIKAAGRITSPAARRKTREGTDLISSYNARVEDHYNYFSLGAKGHPNSYFLSRIKNATNFVFPHESFIKSGKFTGPLDQIVFRAHYASFLSKNTYGKFVFGDTDVLVAHSNARQYIFTDADGNAKTIELDFLDSIVVNEDIIPFMGYLFLLLMRQMGSYQKLLLENIKEENIRPVLDQLLLYPIHEAWVPHSVNIDNSEVVITRDQKVEKSFDNENYHKMLRAILSHDTNEIERLLKKNVDIDICNSDDKITPLIFALSDSWREKIVRYLLDKGADTSARTDYGDVLTYAIRSYPHDTVLIERILATRNYKNKQNLEVGSQINPNNIYSNSDKMVSALVEAVRHDRIELIELLKKYGLTFEKADARPAIIIAAKENRFEIVNYLLDQNKGLAWPNCCEPFKYALEHNQYDLITRMLKINYHNLFNMQSGDKKTGFELAVYEVAGQLIKGNAEIAEKIEKAIFMGIDESQKEKLQQEFKAEVKRVQEQKGVMVLGVEEESSQKIVAIEILRGTNAAGETFYLLGQAKNNRGNAAKSNELPSIVHSGGSSYAARLALLHRRSWSTNIYLDADKELREPDYTFQGDDTKTSVCIYISDVGDIERYPPQAGDEYVTAKWITESEAINKNIKKSHKYLITKFAKENSANRIVNNKELNSNLYLDYVAPDRLIAAIVEQDKNKIEQLLERGVSVYTKTTDNIVPMSFALEHGTKEIIELLVTKGDGNLLKPVDGEMLDSPLAIIAAGGNVELAKWVLDKKLDSKIKKELLKQSFTEDGKSPLSQACKNANYEMVEYLLAQGVDASGNEGLIAFFELMHQENDEEKVVPIAELILKHGFDVNFYAQQDFEGYNLKNYSALCIAALYGYPQVAKKLLERKPNKKTIKLKSALDNMTAYEIAYVLWNGHLSSKKGESWNKTRILIYGYMSLLELEDLYAMTECDNLAFRKQILIDEYQLISLDDQSLKHTSSFLYSFMRDLIPENFSHKVELMLTADDNQMIKAVPGFENPVIAIHKDFLLYVSIGDKHALDELRFGLRRELLYIHKHILSIGAGISTADEYALDREATLCCSKGQNTAVNYLRHAIEFSNKHASISATSLDKELIYLGAYDRTSYGERIKNLETYSLQNNNIVTQNHNTTNSIDQKIIAELKKTHGRCFFIEEYQNKQTKVNKISYLTSCLPELQKELLPYELVNVASRRAAEFCFLLRTIGIDFNDVLQREAADKLIDTAFELRIPGFDSIYRAIIGTNKRLNLGVFRRFQESINNFINAKTYQDAEDYAKEVIEYSAKLENCFKNHTLWFWSKMRFEKYKQDHDGEAPTKNDRYFGVSADLAEEYLDITGFNIKDKKTPWDQHLQWAKESKKIVMVLVRLGVQDERLWDLLGMDELREIFVADEDKTFYEIENDNQIAIMRNRKNTKLIEYLSKRHKLDDSMFGNADLDFEAAFCEFFDKNIYQLQECTNTFNHDTPAVKRLLDKFAEIAINGTLQEKNVVKSFFFERSDKRDLRHLLGFSSSGFRESLASDHLYFQFLWHQRYQDVKFDLFQNSDIRANIYNLLFLFDRDQLPIETFCDIFEISKRDFSLECLEQLLPKAAKQHLTHIIIKTVMHHIDKYGPYDILNPVTADFLQLIVKNEPHGSLLLNDVLKKFTWNLANSFAHTNGLTPLKMAFIYRTFDQRMQFPSLELQQQYGDLVITRIERLSNLEQRLEALETLLFHSENEMFCIPLSDVNFKNRVIDLWVKDIALKYGKDTGQRSYLIKLMDVIESVFARSKRRDCITILNKLTTAIESQELVSRTIGTRLEPEQYGLHEKSQYSESRQLGAIAKIFSYLAEEKADQIRTLDFLSLKLEPATLHEYALHLIKAGKARDIVQRFSHDQNYDEFTEDNIEQLKDILRLIYYEFWDRDLSERAVIINYLLIPATTTATEEMAKQAYEDAFLYVTNKLFPDADKNDNDSFAVALLKAYLDEADEKQRGYLLAALLVTTNETRGQKESESVGKKLALLCEQMGPAYVKVAQAIHSYPGTPEDIRCDLAHVKSRANPPPRWVLWRLLEEYLSKEDRARIMHVGNLLGSASYNLALSVEYIVDDGDVQNLVLLMLRENAEAEAEEGFKHLLRAIEACDHSKMKQLREPLRSMIREAKELSHQEMDRHCGDRQHKIAQKIYNRSIKVTDEKEEYTVNFTAAESLKSGNRYRLLTEMKGKEFNNIENSTVRRIVAKAVVKLELINMFSGDPYDCDRHGNQLKIDNKTSCLITGKINIGLYDFGEMSEKELTPIELTQVHDLISELPRALTSEGGLDALLAEHIKQAETLKVSATNLMRMRKGLLALHDFSQELSAEDFFKILMSVAFSKNVHSKLRYNLQKAVLIIPVNKVWCQTIKEISKTTSGLTSMCRACFFKVPVASELEVSKNTIMNNL